MKKKRFIFNHGDEMPVTVRIPTPLRRLTNGLDRVEVTNGRLDEVLDSLEAQYPGLKERILDGDGGLRHFVNVYVNTEDVRQLNGLQTVIKSGDEISIVPAVAGG